MRYGKLFCFLGLSASAILVSGLPALSQESPASGKDCFTVLQEKISDREKKESKDDGLRSKRVELYYYRNAANVVDILSKLPLEGEGCVTTLPLNEITPGVGVGRGGGNIILLYGTNDYIENAQRFITSIDLPLPGIDLQMWGVQISSKDPDKLAETMSKVRWRIQETRRLIGDTLAAIEGVSQSTLQNFHPDIKVDSEFTTMMESLGYEDAIDGLGGKLSILEIFLVGLAVENPQGFYQDLYRNHLANGHRDKNNKFVAANKDLQPYFDALKNDTNRPPFERTFRSRGLEPYCQVENKDFNCEQWD